MCFLFSLVFTIFSLFAPSTEAASKARYLNVTSAGTMSGASVIQCWQLLHPFVISDQPGTQGSLVAQLGDLSNATYSIIPAGTNGGPHTAPYPQYVVFVAGAAQIKVPNSTQETFIHAGKNGLFFAADTAALSAVGHVSIFTKETVLMQVPTAGGIVPPHTVLYKGPCRGEELLH